MVFRKALFFIAALILVCAVTAFTADAPKELPRNQTLYFNGWKWGAPTNFNPINTNADWPVGYNNEFLFTYETLFMYNMITSQAEPLLGKSYKWTDKNTLRIDMQTVAKFSDGHAVTAEDVAYSYMLAKKYDGLPWVSYMQNIKEVVAQGAATVLIKMDPENANPLYVVDSITRVYVLPKHIWTAIEEKAGNKIEQIRQVFNENPVASGPYKVLYYDDTRIICVRDDNYWGKALFGKLPAPKYLAHMIYKSNDAGNNAFRNGEVDVSQQFMPQVWTLWKNKEPYKTYLSKLPYYIGATTPMIVFNMSKKGLDVPEVRRAIGMCIDYQKISEVAMSGYSATVVPGVILQTPVEKKLVDESQVKSLLFGMDVDGANTLLDSIGAAKGADGVRVLKDGTRLGPWDLSCPYGWTDWNASLEIVAQSAKKIGIELRTKFPDFPPYWNDLTNGNVDIGMWLTSGPGLAQPWDRARFMMLSKDVPPVGQPATWNFGRYKNARADEIILAIPNETDPAKLKALYTELDKIFLKDIPVIQLMYRPWAFYQVYEKVWKGFPDDEHNPKNISPTSGMGSFIKALYDITPVK